MLYARDVVTPQGFELVFVIAHPDDSWSVVKSIDEEAEKLTLDQMLKKIRHADLVVPHLFCEKGLTDMRIFFEDILGIPIVGSSGHTLKLAQNKHLTKLICADAGVPVPSAQKIRITENDEFSREDLKYPIIVKPNNADNSDGVSLVRNEIELEKALEKAAEFDIEILIENFIPGRELRGAIVELERAFTILPFIEYGVHKDQPIRNPEDKLKFDGEGKLLDQSDKENIPAVCPAQINEELKAKLSKLMITCHKALGCRDFSMYDFRVHEETGEPYLLEAGLFWSFSEKSMISNMLATDGKDLLQITEQLWKQAVLRGE